MIKRGSEQFSGYNKPKRTPNHPTKSHAVLAKSGDEVKLIRFGQQGVKGSPDGTKRNEADILAGVLPLGLLADEEQRKKLYELMPSLLGE